MKRFRKAYASIQFAQKREKIHWKVILIWGYID